MISRLAAVATVLIASGCTTAAATSSSSTSSSTSSFSFSASSSASASASTSAPLAFSSTSAASASSSTSSLTSGDGGGQVDAQPAFDGGPITDGSTTHTSDADAKQGVAARDWARYPAIAQVDGVTELWVVSDIHADYKALTKLLTAAKVLTAAPATPAGAQWGAGSAALVIVGDSIDKGPDAPDVLSLIIALQAAAAASQGQVIMTMGNHEAEFLANPENSSASGTNGIDSQLQAASLGIDATAAGDDPIGAFIYNLPVAARVDDWFFVHAGNTGGATIAQLTSQIESGVNASGFSASVLLGADSMLEARLSGTAPQWWDATGNATTLLTAWTAALGTKHLVMGHQPGAVGITGGGANRPAATMASEYGGLLFLVDTGMSVDVDDTGGALLHVTAVGTASEAWEEVTPSGATKSL